jgi:hypothetical protein
MAVPVLAFMFMLQMSRWYMPIHVPRRSMMVLLHDIHFFFRIMISHINHFFLHFVTFVCGDGSARGSATAPPNNCAFAAGNLGSDHSAHFPADRSTEYGVTVNRKKWSYLVIIAA